MELTQLRHFLAVLGAGSINRAARQLNIRQPSLSQSIKALERSVGAELLLRAAGGVRATRIGETFAKYAQIITREADKATAEVATMRGLGAGRISLAIHSALACYLAPTALADFLGRSVGVQIDIAVFSFSEEEIVRRLQRAEWDLAVTLCGVETKFPPDVSVECLRAVESRVYCGAQHPLAAKADITLADLGRFEWITSTLGLAEVLLSTVFANRSPPPTVRIRTDSMELIPGLAAVSPFLCILPVETAAQDVAAGRLMELRQSHIRSSATIGILTSGLVSRTTAIRALVLALTTRAEFAPATPVLRKRLLSAADSRRAPKR
jgi:DNA-binding transcriptional LysR family regulator